MDKLSSFLDHVIYEDDLSYTERDILSVDVENYV